MPSLSETFRARAKEMRDASNVLLKSPELSTSIEKQVAATVGQVNATVLDALADMADLQTSGSQAVEIDKRAESLKRNHAIRMAAARGFQSGNWDEYDRLVAAAESGAAGEQASVSPPPSS
jgi:hypothetical protein